MSELYPSTFMNAAICHGCFRIISRARANERKCSQCGATHFSWLEPQEGETLEACRARAEARIRNGFVSAGMDDAARMAFVREQ